MWRMLQIPEILSDTSKVTLHFCQQDTARQFEMKENMRLLPALRPAHAAQLPNAANKPCRWLNRTHHAVPLEIQWVEDAVHLRKVYKRFREIAHIYSKDGYNGEICHSGLMSCHFTVLRVGLQISWLFTKHSSNIKSYTVRKYVSTAVDLRGRTKIQICMYISAKVYVTWFNWTYIAQWD